MRVPNFLRAFWRGWRALAVKLGHFNGLVLLAVLYWVVIGIIGFFFRLLRQDPLGRRPGAGSAYHKKDLGAREIARYLHLY
jgi:hypothetical protein